MRLEEQEASQFGGFPILRHAKIETEETERQFWGSRLKDTRDHTHTHMYLDSTRLQQTPLSDLQGIAWYRGWTKSTLHQLGWMKPYPTVQDLVH